MKVINVLSQETIDKIAAGEVVANPASVVKELVENSIDAGASAISVEIKDGGLSYIRITDNGEGISREMIETAFLRHATSKITEASELDNVKSLGFRGEALSSIAAVSFVELITKTKNDMMGSKYEVEGGRNGKLSEIGAPDGTTFIVRQLFYNTPARKKFLKSSSTEGSYVFEVVEHLALSHPEIAFKLVIGGNERIVTSGNGSLKDVIYQIYGRNIALNVLDLFYEDDEFCVNGFIGKSVISRGNRAFEHLYINSRYVISNSISKAVEEGYYGYMMGHQFPFFVIFIDFKKPVVDVNVHPAKTEVRIEDEEKYRTSITKIVYNRLSHREDIIDALPVYEIEDEIIEEEKVNTDDIELDISNFEEDNVIKSPEPFETQRVEEVKSVPVYTPEVPQLCKTEQVTFLTNEAIKKHRIVGQVFDTYWIIEYENKMYIIDQHAAHEKVLFEKTMERIKSNKMTSQQISPPMMVTLSASDYVIFERYKSAFEEIGFAIEGFGQNDLCISAVPDNMLGLDPMDLFNEMLEDSESKKISDSHEMIIDKVASMSCKAAVKGNNNLSLSEVDALVNDLLKLDNPYHCPHGRPTMISFSEYELEKKFKRIV